FWIRCGAQEHRIDDAEHRAAGADADGQYQNGNQRSGGSLANGAHRILQIGKSHEMSSGPSATRFLSLLPRDTVILRASVMKMGRQFAALRLVASPRAL